MHPIGKLRAHICLYAIWGTALIPVSAWPGCVFELAPWSVRGKGPSRLRTMKWLDVRRRRITAKHVRWSLLDQFATPSRSGAQTTQGRDCLERSGAQTTQGRDVKQELKKKERGRNCSVSELHKNRVFICWGFFGFAPVLWVAWLYLCRQCFCGFLFDAFIWIEAVSVLPL